MLRAPAVDAGSAKDARPGRPRGRRPAFVVTVVVLGAGLWACWSVTVDDAYITYRYSANLAQGFGPTWNPGQDPVEGYTNFLWMLWHVPWVWLGVPLPLVSKVTSAICAALIGWILVTEPRTRAGVAVAVGAFVLFLPTWIHVDAGLETAPFALAVLRGVVLSARLLRDDDTPVHPWEPPLLFLVAGMLRPDGILALTPPLLVWAVRRRGRPGTWLWMGSAVVVGVAYTTWRWSYFGHPLPNTFYVKVGVEAATDLRWVTTTGLLLLPLVLLAAAAVVPRATRSSALLALAGCLALYAVPAVTAPAMDYLSRFAWHGFPLLCLAAGWALDSVRQRAIAAVLAMLAVAWTCTAGFLHTSGPSMVNYGQDLRRAHIAIGLGLADAELAPDRRTVAMTDAGAVPYFSGWRATDYIGLNDERIAHGTSATDALLADRPTVVVATGPTPEMPHTTWGTDLPRVVGARELVAVARVRPDYYEQVYADRDVAPELRATIGRRLAEGVAVTDGRYDQTYGRWLDRLFG